MNVPPIRPQTARGVVGQVVIAMIVFGAVSAIMDRSNGDPMHVPGGILTGVLFGTINVAFRHRQLPVASRVPPVHAIGLAVFNLGMIAWVMLRRVDPTTREWVTWVPPLLVTIPAIYLLIAGARQLWRESHDRSVNDAG